MCVSLRITLELPEELMSRMSCLNCAGIPHVDFLLGRGLDERHDSEISSFGRV